MTARLGGRSVLVTGAARGQGAAHAARLCREGATVFAADILDEPGTALADELRGQGGEITYLHLDVSSEDGWRAAVAAVESASGRLDGLVNNAGIVHVTPIEQEDLASWTRLLDVNLTGTFLGLRAAIPLLRRSDAASVINVSSIFGPAGAVGYAAYCASKAAILGLTRAAALELAPDGIRVNALVPGGVSTPMNTDEPDGGVVPETPLRRRAHVDELAAAVAYLLSSDASFVTGTELVVDGGFLAR